MKKPLKLFLYVGVPLLCLVAVWVYNNVSGNDSLNEGPGKGKAEGFGPGGPGGRGGRGGGPGGFGGPGGPGRGPGMGRPLPVTVSIAEYGTGESGILRLGTLVANEKVDVSSELSGRVTDVNFNEGQHVKKGAVLVKLNDDELRSQLKRAEYELLLLSQRLERQKVLLEKDAVSRETYDNVLTQYNVLKEEIEALSIRIDKMKIRAPFDGVIGFRQVSKGAFLQPGAKIATLVDMAKLRVEFSIPEKYVANKLVGSKASFTVEGINRTFDATIYAIDPQIDVTTRTILLRAMYNNSDGLLKPGMSARVSVKSTNGTKRIFAPSQAVVPDVNGRFVWLKKGGKAVQTYVETGDRSTDKVEIMSGLNVGDSLIITGLMQLKNDMPVIVNN